MWDLRVGGATGDVFAVILAGRHEDDRPRGDVPAVHHLWWGRRHIQ